MDSVELNALLGPGSATRDMLADLSTLYSAFPSFIYPVLSAKGGKGVDDHDRIGKVSVRAQVRLEDVIGRARDTVDLVLGVVFADDERVEVANAIREIHRFIHGELDDGTLYHAWERDLWNWTWAAIVLPLMEVHGQLRGWPSPLVQQKAYEGLWAIGQLFGADQLPEQYEDLIAYRDGAWMDSVDPHAAQAASFLLAQLRRPSSFRAMPWLPGSVLRVVSWPIRHLARVGLLIATTDALNDAIRIELSRRDKLSMKIHRRVWKVLPVAITRGWVGWYMAGRIRFGKMPWRTHYSPESLQHYRNQMRNARRSASPEPVRPSAISPN
ncbi:MULTISPECIES: oxygenase MpaB family protein [unclassified Mycobacterium]|uniref:oxygenase MpaB family protein n=1 Tax=unclassified Mycobacterium TaxID=2642494 RepID=UPI00099401AE|nr:MULTISPECIES: oxygenase MpaB family protein [unclassified Mycobacterium]